LDHTCRSPGEPVMNVTFLEDDNTLPFPFID
jgi:hypothetical protein